MIVIIFILSIVLSYILIYSGIHNQQDTNEIENELNNIRNRLHITPFPSNQHILNKPPFNIDIVFCYGGQILKTNNKRQRDNFELKYSMRSISLYMPWINNIYLIVPDSLAINLRNNSLFPSWLNVNTLVLNNIYFIAQSSIFHNTNNGINNHNSNAIEMNIMRIRNLSEHFIYFNDDFFIGKPLSWTFFFNPQNNLPRWPLNHYIKYYKMDNFDRPRNKHKNVYSYSVSELKGKNIPNRVEYYMTHSPRPLTKSILFKYIDEMYPDYFLFMESHKERWCSSPSILKSIFKFKIKYFCKLLYLFLIGQSWYDTNHCTHEETLFLSLFKSYLNGEILIDIMDDPPNNEITNYYIYNIRVKEKCQMIQKLKPYTFNINDDFGKYDTKYYKQEIDELHKCLEMLFPNQAKWEI